MKDRLSRFLKSEGLTSLKFAELMEVQPSSISHILSGRNKPSFDFIEKMLARFPELDPDWLILGKGEMHRSAEGSGTEITNVNQSVEREIPFRREKETDREITNVITVETSDPVRETGSGQKETGGNAKQGFTTVNPVSGNRVPPYLQTDKTHREGPVRDKDVSPLPPSEDREIERIVVFYTDRTFTEYRPE